MRAPWAPRAASSRARKPAGRLDGSGDGPENPFGGSALRPASNSIRSIRMFRRFLPYMTAAAFLALTSSSAHAQITHLAAVMNGASEIPPVVTNGTGRADYVLNTFTHTLKYN